MLLAQENDKQSYLLKVNNSFDEKTFLHEGGEIRSRAGNIISTWIPKGKIDFFKTMKGIDAFTKAGKIQPHLNKAVKNGNVDKVWAGLDMEQGYSGKNVLIGVTDWGFDYTHPCFYDTNLLQNRILRAWDQFKTAGPAPDGFTYGTEIIGMDNLIDAQCDTSNIYGLHYHGTHVASIAGGSGGGIIYRGVAYDANFLLTTFLVDEAAVMDAFVWMYEVAQEMSRRLVVNMSWGLYYMDNPDGSGPLSEVMKYFSERGVVFVSSAGNNGDVNFHVSHTFENITDTLKTQFLFDNYGQDHVWGQCISMINSPNTPIAFSFVTLNSFYQPLSYSLPFNSADGDCEVDTFLVVGLDTIFYYVTIEEQNAYSLRPKAALHVKTPSRGNYKFGLIANAEEGEFHAWNVVELTNRVGNWGVAFAAPLAGWKAGDAFYGVSTPGNCDDAITAAAHSSGIYNAGNNWSGSNIAYFSSFGPTVDGRIKPEISAPGSNIISAISSFTDHQTPNPWTTVSFNGRDYDFTPLSGTSMSAPFVAGVVALILEANPWLSPSQIKDIICETAYQDQYTIQHGEVRFGCGKINAYDAVLQALNTTGIEKRNFPNTNCTVFPNPATTSFFVTLETNSTQIPIQIYDFSGKMIEQHLWNAGVHQLNVENYAPGIYFLHIMDKGEKIVKKLIKQ